jgi:hypothetical protein
MTREQAVHCCKSHVTVEVPGDEALKTGFVVWVLERSDRAIVEWDDDSRVIIALRDLVVQYPEQLEVA